MDLPGERWPLLAAIGAHHRDRGDEGRARALEGEAAGVAGQLAATITDTAWRARFERADPIQSLRN